ncbi:hypothetical protein CBS101457_001251 [Exobasidium rhododendri]|nr:hypothetical protein CBS101457_001251 [Exobasidium rhododendri]
MSFRSYTNRKKTSTTNLPATLREELGIGENGRTVASDRDGQSDTRVGKRGGGDYRRGRVEGRKEARKAERKDRKASKVRTVPRKQSQGSFRTVISATQEGSLPDARRPTPPVRVHKGKERAVDNHHAAAERPAHSSSSNKQKKHVDDNVLTPLQRLMSRGGDASDSSKAATNRGQVTKRRRIEAPLTTIEKQEEDEIAWLEAHLGGEISKEKKKPKVSSSKRAKVEEEEGGEDDGIDGGEDGLDDLLDDLDRFYPGMYDGSEGSKSEGSGSEDSEGQGSSEHGEDEEEGEEEISDAELEGEEEVEEEVVDDEEGVSDFMVEGDDEISDTDTKTEEKGPAKSEMIEQGIAERYVPPALRRRAAETGADESEEMQKLRRQAKGLLNRLGEGNIETIVMEIAEGLYRQHSRANVTKALTDIVIQTINSSSNLVETFVVLHAAFVASLHRLIGVEFGAYFLQNVVESWLRHYNEARGRQENDIEGMEDIGKESKNLVVLIADLYNLGMLACPLVFDIVRLTLGIEEGRKVRAMTELDVELLLKVVKTCGPQLRHDDPTSLKTIIQLAQEQQSDDIGGQMSSRAKFMLEALDNLKNNRTKSLHARDLEQQSIARMKKYLAGLGRKRTVRNNEPLRVGLKDLREVDKRGKWWLVGAAWAGYDFGTKATADSAETVQEERKVDVVKEDAKEEKLLQIARQHGMNTTIRQSIFVILISSQDYLEALEKLQLLKFKKDNQRREIIRVLLHCIGSEANYNPYYVILATRLAVQDVGTRFTLQYCLWDYLRNLGERKVGGRSVVERDDDEEDSEGDAVDDELFSKDISDRQIANVARAYGWWFAKGAINLSAMKVIDFTSLKRRGVAFLQQITIHLLLSCQTSSPALNLAFRAASSDGNGKMFHGQAKEVDQAAKESIESVFVKGTLNNVALAQGLLFFFERNLKAKECSYIATQLGANVQTQKQLVWAQGIAKQILKVGSHSSNVDKLL